MFANYKESDPLPDNLEKSLSCLHLKICDEQQDETGALIFGEKGSIKR
jgi:hypothetical protein